VRARASTRKSPKRNISSAFIDLMASHELVRTCQNWSLAFLKRLPQHSLPARGGCTRRLYQWLTRRASFFRSDTSAGGVTRTVRTEVTVERQTMALLVGNGEAAGFDICPLCGSKLTPVHTQHERPGHRKASCVKGSFQADRPPPTTSWWRAMMQAFLVWAGSRLR
jgi:hypothetical protein